MVSKEMCILTLTPCLGTFLIPQILQCTFGNMPLSSKCTVHFR